MPLSPTAEGFRAAFRRPSLALAEITWRWVTGATATALFFFGLFEYLNSLPVTNGELLFLRTRHPYLVGQAIAHILRGSLSRAVMAALVAALMLGVLWMVAASLGRMATVRALLDYFRGRFAGDAVNVGEGDVRSNVSTSETSPFRSLLRLNFLRAAVALAAAFGLVGAAILAGFASPQAHPRPGLAFFLFLPLAALVGLAGWALNWLLSLAGMFAVRDGADAVGAIAEAVTFCRDRTGAVFAVSTWAGLAHLVAFVSATTVVGMPLGLARVLPWRLVMLGVIVVTLAYLAVVDWLHIARLAGYVYIAEMPEALLAPLPLQPAPAPPVQTTIDREEPILSDVPNLAVEA
jgi:hypothetical protein